MNYGAFIKQLKKGGTQTAEANTERKATSRPKELTTPVVKRQEIKTEEDNLRAHSTQDFRMIFDQMTKREDAIKEETSLSKKSIDDNQDSYSESNKNRAGFQAKGNDEIQWNFPSRSPDGRFIPNQSSNPSGDLPTSKLSDQPKLRLAPLIPMAVNRQGIKQELDEKTKDDIAERVCEMILAKLGSRKAADLFKNLKPRSLEDEDQEEIERMLQNDHQNSNFNSSHNGSEFNNGGYFNNDGFQRPGLGGPGFQQPPDTNAVFFSGYGMKPVQLTEEALQAAKARLGEMGFEDEVEGFDAAAMGNQASFSNPFVTLSASNNPAGNFSVPFSNPKASAPFIQERQRNELPAQATKFSTGFEFGRPLDGDNTGPISFLTGDGAKKVTIDPEAMKKAMALLALSDEEDEDKEKMPPNTFDENARLGLPRNATEAGANRDQAENGFAGSKDELQVHNDQSVKSGGKMSENDGDSPKKDLNEEYSLKAVIERNRQELNSKASGVDKEKKSSKNPFGAEAKKVAKKTFEVPHRANNGLLPRNNFPPPKPNAVRIKTPNSKFQNSVEVDTNRNQISYRNLNKRRKLIGYKEKLVTRNYGANFLTMQELYDHLEPELRQCDVAGIDSFLNQLFIEMRFQLPKVDIDQGWVEHHLTMLTRKYYNRVKNEGASSSSSTGRTSTIIPYKVNLSNIVTDLIFRSKKEEFFGRLSVLRSLFEGQLPADRRMCLMVSSISKCRDKWTLELTDGWYIVFTELYTNEAKEEALKTNDDYYHEFNNNLILRLILKGKLKQGDKIEVSHLTIEREENQPIYSKVRLQTINYNSMKKLLWNTQMGQLYTKLKPTKLRSIKPSGGIVPMVDVLILEKRGIKICNTERDQFMIKAQAEEGERMAVSFSVTVIDSIHLDPLYDREPELHMVTFKNVDPGKYVDLCVGQRLQIFGVKLTKTKIYPVQQANFEKQYPMGLHLLEVRRNSSLPMDVPTNSKTQKYLDLLATRKKGFQGLEEIKELLINFENQPKTKCDDFMMTAALKYVKHSGNLCLFHFYEKHFIQVEIRTQENAKKAQKKDGNKSIPAQTNFWEGVMKDLTHISETNIELLLFYDLCYTRSTKILDLRSRGKIHIHKFQFDVVNDYMLGENFVLSNLDGGSIERYLISEYKKAKNMKLGDNDSIAQLLIDMSKYPMTQ